MKRDLAALSLVVLAVLIFGQAIFMHGASPFRGDIPLQFYPWKCYAQSMLASGEIPYWNPYTYGGAPFLANVQSAVFYPLDLILFVFPMEWFYGLSLLLHLLLGAIGAYFLARICGATSFPSVVAGIAYGLNGFTMIHIPAGNHLTYAGAAWIPWMLWATAGFVTTARSRLPWALAGTFISFLHFLCGHPQMMFYSLVFSFFFCLFLGLWQERRKERSNYLAPIVRTGVWSAFLVFGVGMAAFQLFPTLQYFGEANRASSLSLEMATEFSFAPHRLITLLCPDFYGTMIRGSHYDSFVYWSCAYAGFVVPMLALIPLFHKKRSSFALALAALAFLGLLLAWGRGNPVYALIYHLPGFGHFRAPAKYLPYYIVSVCVLASLGIEYWGNRTYQKIQSMQPIRCKSIRLAMAIFLFMGFFGALLKLGIPFFEGLPGEAVVRATQKIFHVDLMQRMSEPGVTDLDRIKVLERLASAYRLVYMLAVCLIGYGIYRLTPKAPRFALSAIVGVVLFLDLNYYGQRYLQASLVSLEAIRASANPSQEITYLRPSRSSPRPDRMMNLKDLDIPNVFMHWRVYNIAGYDPMSLRAYNQQIGELENWKEGDYHDNIQLTQTNHPVLDRLNVRYVVTQREQNDPSLRLLSSGRAFRVYERTGENRTWAAVRSDGGKWLPADGSIDFIIYAPHEIAFDYTGPSPVVMRAAEWDYPGWRGEAVLGNRETIRLDMKPTDDGFRSFEIPAGTKKIRLFYHAPRIGWVVSGLCGLFFVFLAILVIVSRTDRFLSFMQRAMGRNF